jgi:hypothetical protein
VEPMGQPSTDLDAEVDGADGPADSGGDPAEEEGPGDKEDGAQEEESPEDPQTAQNWTGRRAEHREAAAPPLQQRDHPEDLDRPGEFAILPKREGATDATWEVPTWEKGYWWRYENRHNEYHSLCDYDNSAPALAEQIIYQEVTDVGEMTGSDPDWTLPVYELDTTRICTNQPITNLELNYSQDHLTFVRDTEGHRLHGYTAHKLLFPLEDGKQWVYVGDNRRFYQAEVTYHPEYDFNGEPTEAWQVTVKFERSGRTIVEHTYYGVEVGWIIRQENLNFNTVLELIDWHDGQGGPGGDLFAFDRL